MDKKEINELEKALDFFEEITWLLDRKNFKLNGKPEMLRRILHNQVDSDLANINFADNESDIQQLIGILPGLFQDLDLFPTNKLIVSFAEELLHINIKRGEKINGKINSQFMLHVHEVVRSFRGHLQHGNK